MPSTSTTTGAGPWNAATSAAPSSAHVTSPPNAVGPQVLDERNQRAVADERFERRPQHVQAERDQAGAEHEPTDRRRAPIRRQARATGPRSAIASMPSRGSRTPVISSGAVAAPSCAPRNATAAGRDRDHAGRHEPGQQAGRGRRRLHDGADDGPEAERGGRVARERREPPRAADADGLADPARQHGDAEGEQREAADEPAERLAPVLGLDAQVVGLAALVAVGDAQLRAPVGRCRRAGGRPSTRAGAPAPRAPPCPRRRSARRRRRRRGSG